MKLLCLTLCLTVATVTCLYETAYQSDLITWNLYKTKFNKTYASLEEDARRFAAFMRNVKYVERHNELFAAGAVTHSVELNHLADLTTEEYAAMNGFRQSFLTKRTGIPFVKSAAPNSLPASVDWRTKGAVTPVKNQGRCGSCWAFSTTGAMEGAVALANGGKLVSMSEQNLVDCVTDSNGCSGGLPDFAFEYIQRNDGIDGESSYPYEGRNGACRYEAAASVARDTNHVDLARGDEDALKEAVATKGPISIAIDASHPGFQMYRGGENDVYYSIFCSHTRLDHAVLVVGYGTTPDGKDYWLVKNSWGTSWGEDGYIKMARNRNNNCGIATKAAYPLV